MRRKYCNTLAFSVVILMLASSISSLNLIASVAGATAKEKLVFKDDFSKTNLKQWTTMLGTWTVQNGKLTQMDNTVGDSWYDRPNIVAHCEVSSDFKIETKFNHPQGSIAILFRYQDIGNTEYVILHGGSNVIMGATVDGGERSVWHDYTYSLATEHTVTIDVHGSAVNVYIDGVFAASDNYADRGFVYSSGPIGFDTWYTSVSFDDVVVTEPAKVMHVYEGESIQAAVDAVFTGGKVIVHKGTYYQSFTVNKPMTVQGEGATLDLLGYMSAVNAITVNSGGVTISGFTIKIPAVMYSTAIYFGVPSGESLAGSTAKNNIIYSGFTGIFIDSSPNENIKIWNNVISAGYPIFSYNRPKNIDIKNNQLSAIHIEFGPDWFGGDGISLLPGDTGYVEYSEIRNNIINAAHLGITVSNIANLQIRGNTISAATAIKADNSPSLTISNNQLTAKANPQYTQPPAPNGILTTGALSNTLIRNNYIDSKQWGIFLSVSASTQNIQILKNTISAVNTAVWVKRPANPDQSNLQIIGNTLSAGTNGIQLTGLTNPVIIGNTLSAGTNGIQLTGLTNPVIIGNVVYSDNTGIYLESISGATVEYNAVHINEAKPGYPTGILISGGTGNQVAMNIVTGDFITGIFLSSSNLNTIDKNVLTGVYRYDPNYLDAGIRLWGSNDNTGTKNLITGVRLPIDDQGSGNIFTP